MGMIVNPFGVFGGGSGDPFYSVTDIISDMDGTNGQTTFTDFSATPATLSSNNSAAISTTQSKFGGASLLLNGTNQYVSSNRQINIGTGSFTLEAHIRPTAAQTGRFFSAQNSSSTNAVLAFRVDSTGSLTLILRNSGGTGTLVLTSATSLIAMNDTVWNHVAATRDIANSNRIDLWINGVSVANNTSGTNPDLAGNMWGIGSQYGSGEFFKGYIDNPRITRACRYTATFTPPTSAYPHF